MAEWPKTLSVCDSCGRGEVEGSGTCAFTDPDGEMGWTDIPVIPADLGRELYEAVKGGSGIALNRDDFGEQWRRISQALARYEREVGK